MTNISNIQDNFSFNNSEVGDLAYFLTYISDCLPYVVLESLGSIIGVIGIALNQRIINIQIT